LSPHFRFEKQIKTVQTWCFCTKKKNDWSWGLLMENLKYWLLIGRANLILTNGLSFTVYSQPFKTQTTSGQMFYLQFCCDRDAGGGRGPLLDTQHLSDCLPELAVQG